MKVSVIIPTYNEEKAIEDSIRSILSQEYSKEDFELIIIEDGSPDTTNKVVKETISKFPDFDITLIEHPKNLGRLQSRIDGVKKAKYDRLFFTDSRCRLSPDVLQTIMRINYQPLIGNAISIENNFIARFGYLFRKKLFKESFGENFKEVYITKDNFDNISKGTGIFFVEKQLFLDSQPSNLDKNTNDDTHIFHSIVFDHNIKILKTPDVKAQYLTRGIKKTLKHTFERGPKFVDYYLDPRKKNFWLFIAGPWVAFAIFASILIFFQNLIIPVLVTIALLNVLLSIWLAENIKDFFISLFTLPLFTLLFEAGITKGLIQRSRNK